MEEFIANAALLAGHLTQQCDKAVNQQKSSAAELQQAASEVGLGIAAGKQELAQHARNALREALAQEIPIAVEAFTQSGDRIRRLTDQLQREQAASASRMQLLAWKSFGAVLLASITIAAGTAYFAWINVQRAENAHVQAQVLEALQQVSITSCDGKPCVKLEDGLRRWSGNDEYVLIDTSSLAQPKAPD